MLPAKFAWALYWEKHRTRILQTGALLLLVIARPSHSNAVFGLGFLIALAGEAIRFWAAGHIHKTGLSREGPYAMTRHPLYFGTFVMGCGFAILCTSKRHWLASAIVWAALFATFYWLYRERIDHEEADLSHRFGSDYADYKHHVPRFWPDFRRWQGAVQTMDWDFHRALRNKEQRTLWALLGLALFLRFKMVYL